MIHKDAPPKDMVTAPGANEVAIFERTEKIDTAWIRTNKDGLVKVKA